jgi:hypothetical protein
MTSSYLYKIFVYLLIPFSNYMTFYFNDFITSNKSSLSAFVSYFVGISFNLKFTASIYSKSAFMSSVLKISTTSLITTPKDLL